MQFIYWGLKSKFTSVPGVCRIDFTAQYWQQNIPGGSLCNKLGLAMSYLSEANFLEVSILGLGV